MMSEAEQEFSLESLSEEALEGIQEDPTPNHNEDEIGEEAAVVNHEEHSEEPNYEDLASQDGWRPKSEWKGDVKDWVDAKSFVQRKPLFDRIHAMDSQLKVQSKTIEHLTEVSRNIEKKTREATISELKQKQFEAAQDNDEAGFNEYSEKLADAYKEYAPSEEAGNVPDISPEVVQWADRNPWFKEDAKKQAFMINQQRFYLSQGKNISEALVEAESDVKQKFSADFAPPPNPNRQKPSAVQPSSRDGAARVLSESDLSSEERGIFKILNRMTGMTLEEYTKQLTEKGQ